MFNRLEMLNRRAAQPKFKANEIIRTLYIKAGATVADIGAGGGYFTMCFAEAVGRDGRVYAVDNNAKSAAYVENMSKQNGMTNIEAVLLDNTALKLPEHGCDLIFLRNVFHHLDETVEYFKDLKRFLKPEGRVVIIDYKKRKTFNFIALMGHHVEEETIRKTMSAAGYSLVERYDLLSEQSFTVYQAV